MERSLKVTTKKARKKTPREYIEREAVLSEPLIEMVLATIADGYDPRRCPRCSRKQMVNIYWDYLEAKGVEDSAESKIDMMVDILTLGWSKGVSLIGTRAIADVVEAAQRDVVEGRDMFRNLLSTRTQCCNQ
jgi:hypothetical protein